jgi:predicted nucleic acid-binding protein
MAGRDNCIISGDHHLTDLKTYGSIKIVTPTEFLAIIDRQM